MDGSRCVHVGLSLYLLTFIGDLICNVINLNMFHAPGD